LYLPKRIINMDADRVDGIIRDIRDVQTPICKAIELAKPLTFGAVRTAFVVRANKLPEERGPLEKELVRKGFHALRTQSRDKMFIDMTVRDKWDICKQARDIHAKYIAAVATLMTQPLDIDIVETILHFAFE
jgi:hypothetical protein